MSLTSRWLIIVLLVALGLICVSVASAQGNDPRPPDAAAPQGEPVSTLILYERSHTSQIEPGWTCTTLAQCDVGDMSISGGYTTSPEGAQGFYVLASHRASDRDWQAGGYNGSGGTVSFTTYALCLDMDPPSAAVPQGEPVPTLILYERSHTLDIEPGWTSSATAQCDVGDMSISGGYSTSPWPAPGFYVLASHRASDRGWLAGGYNGSDGTVSFTTYALCLDMDPPDAAVPQGEPVPTLILYERSDTCDIEPDWTSSATAQCDAGDMSISGGHTTSPWGAWSLYVLASHRASDRGWEAGGYNGSDGAVSFTAYALCLDMYPHREYLPIIMAAHAPSAARIAMMQDE